MARNEAAKHPLVEKVSALRSTIEDLRKTGGNQVNHVHGELQALSAAWARAQKWISVLDVKNPQELERLAILTESAVSNARRLPQHGTGPEYEAPRASLKADLSGLLAQVLLQGLLALERDEDVIDKFSAEGAQQLGEQKAEYDQLLQQLKSTLESSQAAAAQAEESARKVGVTVNMTAFSIAADSHRRWAIGWAVGAGLTAVFLAFGALRAMSRVLVRPCLQRLGMWPRT